jgi:hypothetical protein
LCAANDDVRIPPSWAEKGLACADLFSNFLKKYKNLSLRPAERTSLARMTGFIKENMKQFYDIVSKYIQDIVLLQVKSGTWVRREKQRY